MARIPIYDSIATATNSGASVEMGFVLNQWYRSMAVRLFGGQGELRYVSYEFLLSGRNLDSFNLDWYQEFWGDNPSLRTGTPPSLRQFATLNENIQGYMWAREQVGIIGPLGAIDHYDITRNMAMQVPALNQCHSKWFPMSVHAPWVRIAVRNTTTINGASPRLRIWAHVGGHSEGDYTEGLNVPFDYQVAAPAGAGD